MNLGRTFLIEAFALLLLTVTPSVVLGCASRPPLPPRAAELNHEGAAALAAGDLETADARLAVALEYSPRFTEAWVNLGYVELRRGNVDRAKKHFARARSLNPDLPAPHHALGLLADRLGRERDAEAHYRAALKVDPGFVPSRANLARSLFQRGAIEDARDQFVKLTQVDPASVAGYTGLVECLLRLDREGDAEVVLERARTRFGDRPELSVLVARQLLRRGAGDAAEEILEPLTDDVDRSRAAAVWAWIGVARLSRGDAVGARAAASESLAIDGSQSVGRKVLDLSGGSGRPHAPARTKASAEIDTRRRRGG